MFRAPRAAVGRFIGPLLTLHFLRARVLIPLAVMSAYFVAAALLLPAGVNRIFTSRSAEWIVPITILLGVGYVAAARLVSSRTVSSAEADEGLSAGDLPLLLLPLVPVVQYLLLNRDILSPVDFGIVLSFFGLGAALLVLAVPALLRRTGSLRPVMYLGVSFAFCLTSMAALSAEFRWHDWVSLQVLVPRMVGLWLLGWLLYRFGLRGAMNLMIVVFLFANSAVQWTAGERADDATQAEATGNTLLELIGSRRPAVVPSIYLLVYDAYVASETMAGYGIDNRGQERFLEDRGFKLYPHAYSVAAGSLKTMSRVMNVSPNYVMDREGREAVSGSGVVPQLLESYGYETYGIFPSDFFFRGTKPGYDVSFPRPRSSADLLIRAILEGEFRFDVGFDDISREQYLGEKQRVFASSPDVPRFLYSHSLLPGHSQMSGTCLPNEVDLFAEDLAEANREMRQDVETILAHDPGAIVIIAGDHGPRLTKNCRGLGATYDLSEINRLDIQDRLGTFLAIRWPNADFEPYDEITILQDIFPAVFAYLFADAGLLEARMPPVTLENLPISGARVEDGVIVGGLDDGQPLFLSEPND